MSSLAPNTLYYGDCLDWMEQWDDGSVDLIYLDPPFNSKTDYNILFSTEGVSEAQYRAFEDTWSWTDKAEERFGLLEIAELHPAHKAIMGLYDILGPSGMVAYLTYMVERLEHMRRLLKPTGTIYLHCDTTASHYLKIVMDAIFGAENFRNEIIWSYRRWPAKQKNFQRMHDVIFRYTKSGNPTWNQLFEPLAESTLQTWGTKQQVADFSTGRRKPSQTDKESPGAPMRDVWDIGIIAPISKERLGYPTQKPLALLRRIIEASSNPSDIVLDPFCGCGTAVEAARQLNRRWVGVDINPFAIDLIRERRLHDLSIPVYGIPLDLNSARRLAKEQPFHFETWAVTRLPGFIPNTQQVADGGVDGRATLAHIPDNFPNGRKSKRALAQIKGGKFSLSHLRDFIGVIHREQAALGCYVTLERVSHNTARSEAASAGKIAISGPGQMRYEYPRVQLWSIQDYFDERLPNLPIMNDPYTKKVMSQQTMF